VDGVVQNSNRKVQSGRMVGIARTCGGLQINEVKLRKIVFRIKIRIVVFSRCKTGTSAAVKKTF